MSSAEADLSHAGNVLGALVVGLGDRLDDAVTEAAGGPDTAAAALSSMEDFLSAPTVGRVQQVLGLTPSGTVRLLDRLEQLDLVARSAGEDGRVRQVSMTRSGRRVAKAVRTARADVLESALSPLTSRERQVLDALIAKILVGLARPSGATRWICRLCDTGACGRARGMCPFVRVSPPES
jgi:MarR family transcriptional repressor of emrRAB